MSKPFLIFWTIFYIFLLNLTVNQTIEAVILSLWPALALAVLTLILSLFGKHFLKLFLALQLIIASVALFFKWQYGITITEDIMLSGLINDNALTTEMVSFKLILWVALTAFLPIYLLLKTTVHKKSYILQVRSTLIWIGILMIGIASILYAGGYQLRKKGQIRDPRFAQALNHFSPLDAQYALVKARKAQKRLNRLYANIKPPHHQYQMKEKDLLVVVILGEATRGDHFSLNGYSKKTNPKLSLVPNIYSFKNVTSCDTLTINSMHCLSSPMMHTQKDRMPTKAPFSSVMQSLGFNIEIYSLQTLNLFYHYLGYDKLLSKYAILNSSKNGEAKDRSLLPFALQSIKEYDKGRKLVILHTLGSHQTYMDRITHKEKVFTPYCQNADVAQCSHDSLLNAYDNTILEVDTFISEIINTLKKKKALLFYISDHGESLGENGIFFHGKPPNIAPKEQFSIPWLVWLSPSYKKSLHGMQIEKSLKDTDLNRPFSHDNFYHSILGCSTISSKQNDINKSLNICKSLP